jgi:hypothetical protein
MKCYCVFVGSVPKRSSVSRVTPFLSLVSPILQFSATEASIHLTSRETRKGTLEPAKEGWVSGNVSKLKATVEGSTRLGYTGLSGGLEHLKIETRLRGGRFESVKGDCVI